MLEVALEVVTKDAVPIALKSRKKTIAQTNVKTNQNRSTAVAAAYRKKLKTVLHCWIWREESFDL